jgi:hypothetical protein
MAQGLGPPGLSPLTSLTFAVPYGSANQVSLTDRTADATLTETGDSLSSAATLALQAALTATNGADTLASTAAVALSATASVTEAGDTTASSAAIALQASASLTNGADTISSTASLALQATLNATESPDTFTSTAALALQASLTATEGADTLASLAVLPLSSSLAFTEDPDTTDAQSANTDTTWKFGSWLPVKMVGGHKKKPEPAEPEWPDLTAAQLEDYLASFKTAKARAEQDARALEIAAMIRRGIADQIANAHLMHMVQQAAPLMALDDEDAEMMLLAA